MDFFQLNASLELWTAGELLSLPDVDRRCLELEADSKFHGQAQAIVQIKPLWQFSLNLMGRVEGDPPILPGNFFNEDVEESKADNNRHLLFWVRFYSMKLAFLFGELDTAAKYSQITHMTYAKQYGHMIGAFVLTYECLVLLAQARRGKRRHCNIWKVRRCLKILKKWVAGCPDNFLGKQCLLQAELAWTCGNLVRAHSLFRLAIVQNRDQGFWMEEALANEQLGRLYIEEEKKESAIPYLREAQRVYEQWGATAKTQHIEAEFADVWQSVC